MYTDDIKLFAKNEKVSETQIQNGGGFSKEKCAMIVRKSGKRHMREGIEQLNEEKIRMLWKKETYKYLRMLETDTYKNVVMKEKNYKKCLRQTRKLHETKLNGRNLMKGINT